MCGHREYAPNMHDKRKLSMIAAAVVGGVVGATIVWLSRPDPPSCTTLDNGMRACMPIYVVDPPLWLYGSSQLSERCSRVAWRTDTQSLVERALCDARPVIAAIRAFREVSPSAAFDLGLRLGVHLGVEPSCTRLPGPHPTRRAVRAYRAARLAHLSFGHADVTHEPVATPWAWPWWASVATVGV